MPRPDPGRPAALPACIGAGALLAGCLVFDGKTVTAREGSLDSGAEAGADTGADVRVDVGADGAAETGAAPDPGIRCGANDWCSGSTVCCLKLGASGWFGPSTPCAAPGLCANFSQFACDTARECVDGGTPAGVSCCATRESTTTEFQGSSCIPVLACSPASLAVVLCAPGDSTPCPDRQACVAADAADLPPGYFTCQ